jgi:large subunit ribosomal protein L18
MSQTTTRIKNQRRTRRKRRVRAKISGTAVRPRISVVRSNAGVSAQLIDDIAGHTVASVQWTEDQFKNLSGSEQAAKAGEVLAERAKAAGIESAVFDRNGFLYHGRVKAFADGVREGGLAV